MRRRVSLPEDRAISTTFDNLTDDTWKIQSIPTFKAWRVFINHIDSYHGKKLADLLSDRVYVKPRSVDDELGGEEEEEEAEEEERTEEEEAAARSQDDKFQGVATASPGEPLKKYEVIGTASDPEYTMPEGVTRIIRDPKNRETFLKELMDCGFVIYDITDDIEQVEEAQWALKAIIGELERMEKETPKAFKENDDVRYFILISTLLTWAQTKPLSRDEPDLPFSEEDYKKRKPHPNFKKHIQCEKDVVIVKKKFNLKDKLKTLVICAGATYGDDQGPLHYLFRMAWKNAPYLPIFGKGNNKIPLLHVRDLMAVVIDAMQNWPSLRYIVATEQEVVSQSTIVKKISGALTTGKVKNIEQEEAFLLSEVTQKTYDLMTMNLNIDPQYIADRISWHLDLPFRDSINAVVKEFRAVHNLHPPKVIVLGPPASGKTKVAKYLAKHYSLHYIHVKSLIQDTIEELTTQIEEATAEQNMPGQLGEGDVDEEEDVEEEEEVEGTNIEGLQELLNEIEQNIQRNMGRMDDPLLNKLFLRKLRSKKCQNQGYIIDGYPKTSHHAKILFVAENLNEIDEEIDEEAGIDDSGSDYTIMPELVVSLEANDEFLKERIIQRPEWEIQNTHYTEEHMMRRLKEYRNRNTDENTPLQFFDEIEIHPLMIDIEDDLCPDMFPTIYQCLERLGIPNTYGLTPKEAREARQRAEAEAREAKNAERLQQEKEMMEQKKIRQDKMMEWTTLMEQLLEEENERKSLMALPLRHYLLHYIFPTLTQGLIEVANLRPDDPIDYLAEYLFKENPEGKMFHPDYTYTMNSILDVIEQYKAEILPTHELNNKIMEFLKRDDDQRDADGTTTSTSTGSEMDVCGGKKYGVCVTPSFAYDDADTIGEGEGEEDFGSDKSEKHDEQSVH